MSDPQAQFVYDAEDLLTTGFTIPSPAAVCAYVEAVVGSSWWFDQRWPRGVRAETTLATNDAAGGFDDDGFFVRFPSRPSGRWAWHEIVVAHELAHVSVLGEAPDQAHHGPAFCGRFLETFGSLCGESAFEDLCRAFMLLGVAFHTPQDFAPEVGEAARLAVGL